MRGCGGAPILVHYLLVVGEVKLAQTAETAWKFSDDSFRLHEGGDCIVMEWMIFRLWRAPRVIRGTTNRCNHSLHRG